MNKQLWYFIVLLISNSLFSKTLIWDFGGILFEPNKLGVAREIGLHHFLSYMFLDWENPNIEALLFQVLSGIESNYSQPHEKNFNPSGSAKGLPLPPIMCEWQAGTKKGPDIIKLADKHIELLDRELFFESTREKALIKNAIRTMFNPEVLARNVYPVMEGVKLLKDCAALRNKFGQRKHKLIAFSNWDDLSFDSFFARNKHVFKYFDHIVISGKIGLIKPYKEAFQYLIDDLQLNPEDCILIDDQDVNAKGARACGMKALVIDGGDYAGLRSKLVSLGILR